MPVWVSWWNVSQREDGFLDGRAPGKTILPLGDIPSGYPHWHGICVLLYNMFSKIKLFLDHAFLGIKGSMIYFQFHISSIKLCYVWD